jgi:hypothetical protein
MMTRRWWVVLVALFTGAAGQVKADLIVFSNEPAFVQATMPVGPLNFPFAGPVTSLSTEDGRITAMPGPDVPSIAVSNVIGTGFPSSLSVNGKSFSNLDFSLSSRFALMRRVKQR